MTTNISFDPSIWQKNLRALEKRNPQLAERLQETAITNRYIVAETAAGDPVFGITLENGQPAALCHSEHPQQEAEQWVMSLGEEMRKNAHVLLLGFGPGYHPMALYKLSDENTTIWMVEPDASLVKLAFHAMDLTGLIESERVRFAVGFPEAKVAKLLFTGPGGNRMKAEGIRMAFNGITRHLYAEYMRRLSGAIQEAIQMEGLKFKTSELQGKTILQNIMGNLPHILRGAPWKRLIGAAPGIPALILSPGPSLEESIPYLSKIRDKALFIAVDTAHRILHQNEIVSDIVAALDFSELNARHFETISDDEAVLLAFPGIDPSIPERYVGRTYFFDHAGSVNFGAGATQLLKTLHSLGTLGDLVSYGSTAHIALHAARMMGCSPIILVGNDLAFPQDRWYAKGAMQNGLDQPEREAETLLEVPANDGCTVQTSGLYKHYLDTFGELIQGSASPVINTSLNGAKIEGAPWMDLDEALSAHCKKSIDGSFLNRSLRVCLEERRTALLEELQHLSSACRRVRKQVLRLSKQLDGLNPSRPSFRQEMMKIMKSFSDLLVHEARVLNLSTALYSRSSIAFLGRAGQSGLFGGRDAHVNQQVIDRTKDFFLDMGNALQINAVSLKEAVALLSTPE